MRMHADGSCVENGVKRFRGQSEAGHGFATDGASEFASLLFTARADRDLSARASESYRCGTSGAPGTKKEYTTLGEMEFLFERAEHADVIGIRSSERTVGADDDGVYGADIGGEI